MPLITDRIDIAYGYVFAGCNLAVACPIYFFLIEWNNKPLEKIDTMYLFAPCPAETQLWPEGTSRNEVGER